jgi:hypothetical protein
MAWLMLRLRGMVLTRSLQGSTSEPLPAAVNLWARVAPSSGAATEWSERLTPYAVETLVDEARCAGVGARVEIRLTTAVAESELRLLSRALGHLDGCVVVMSSGGRLARSADEGRTRSPVA